MADRAFTDVDDAQEASQQLWRVLALWHTILTPLVALIRMPTTRILERNRRASIAFAS